MIINMYFILSLKYFNASGGMSSMSSMCLRLQRCSLILENTYNYCVIMLYSRESKTMWVWTTHIVVHLVIYCVYPLQHFCMMVVLDCYICSVLECVFNQISSNVEGLFYCVGTVFSSVTNQEWIARKVHCWHRLSATLSLL